MKDDEMKGLRKVALVIVTLWVGLKIGQVLYDWGYTIGDSVANQRWLF
jgi:hypothetical protein